MTRGRTAQEIRTRRRSSAKWERYGPHALPLWVADMDLEIMPEIRAAIIETVDASDLGYPSTSLINGYLASLVRWTSSRYHQELDPDALVPLSNVVQGAYWAVREAGQSEELVVLTPSYPPFLALGPKLGHRLHEVAMIESEDTHLIDFDAFSSACEAARGGVFLLVNPHNPTGRVFTGDELRTLAEIALEHDLWIISDEIHRDLISEGTHTPLATLSTEIAARTITLLSASKTFNLAGLHCAAIHIPSEMRERLDRLPRGLLSGPSLPGLIASTVAFDQGEQWLNETMDLIKVNRSEVSSWAPGIGAHSFPPQGTYLNWLRFDGHGDVDVADLLLAHCGVALSPGREYLRDSTAYARLNLATSTEVMTEALERVSEFLAT